MIRSRHAQQGISLVELLVVLIILGLVSTLAINGGSNAFLMKQKLQNASDKSFNDSLVYHWLRTTIEAAYPLPEFPPTFNIAKMEFTTQEPLLSEDAIARVSWSLHVDGKYVVLTYREGNTAFEVRRWLDAEASFEFVYDDERNVYPSFISLEVDYLAPFGRKSDKILVLYKGIKTFPRDFRQLGS